MKCRFCSESLHHTVIDLGASPPSNSFLRPEQLGEPEIYYPLKLFFCDACHLVQIDEHKAAEEIFDTDYLYFSSFSKAWMEHARAYAEMITDKLSLGPGSMVVEIASNDGYLLQHFVAREIPCLGIEPTHGTAEAARKLGIRVIEKFFGQSLASEITADGWQADLLIGNNVLAHVPDINDFVAGLKAALRPGGTITLEFPHLLRLIQHNQFDTIYHEHFSYFTLAVVQRIFTRHGLAIADVDELPTHGGSLRIYAVHQQEENKPGKQIAAILAAEKNAGLDSLAGYKDFQARADKVKNDFLKFLLDQKAAGKSVAAYAAAAKGNTLLNFAGVRPDLLGFVTDASPHKQGLFLPGSRILVVDEDHLRSARPDFVVLLAWNITDELRHQLRYISEWGGKFVVAVPELKVFAE